MKILYLHQYFQTPEEGGAIRSYYLARALVKNGHQVDLLTGSEHGRSELKEIEGIRVHYLPVKYRNDFPFFQRVRAFLRFVVLALREAKKLSDLDLCYATSTPLTVGLVALRLKSRRGIPYYFEVRDLWPDAPVQMGLVRNPVLKGWLFSLEQRIYNKADKIIGLSPGIVKAITKKVDAVEPVLIPNMSDRSFFSEKQTALQGELSHLKDTFVITYLGALGRINNLRSFLEVAEECQDLPVKFLIVGKGSEEEDLRGRAKDRGFKNVMFLPFQNKEGVRGILSVTDAVYISYLDIPVMATASPNKFFDALAAGKMIIINVEGWIKDLVDENNCGFYCSSQHPDQFREKITPFISNPQSLAASQANAFKLGDRFSRERLEGEFLKLF